MMTERSEAVRSGFISSDSPLPRRSILLKDTDTGNKTLCDHAAQSLPGQPAALSDLREAPLARLV